MSYELTLHIHENSPQGQNIEAVAVAEHVTREEAALRLLAVSPIGTSPRTSSQDRRAAIKAVTGSLRGQDWVLHDFNEEKQAEIEQENQREII